jgi:hypothetical protein
LDSIRPTRPKQQEFSSFVYLLDEELFPKIVIYLVSKKMVNCHKQTETHCR